MKCDGTADAAEDLMSLEDVHMIGSGSIISDAIMDTNPLCW